MSAPLSDAGLPYLRWALVDGVGPLTFGKLLIQFGSAEAAWNAGARELQAVHRIGRDKADRITAQRREIDAKVEAELRAAAEHDVRILTPADDAYPEGLKQLPDPPIALYVKGSFQPTDVVAVGVVGTRRCSVYGGEQARRFGELLAGVGITVVSGLARGVDAFAHHGAIDAGGRTLAVLGNGLREIYPPENAALAERILGCGAWISELPMSAAVRRENFPSRNRIIAGLSLGTLVIEAPQRSGALITARLANDYNREVFAVPGRLGEPNALGTNTLIRDGIAKLVVDLEDVLSELGEVGLKLQSGLNAHVDESSPQDQRDRDAPPASTTAPLSPVERRVYEVIGADPILQDVVLNAAELPPGEVLAALTSLELKRLIKRLPGQLVVRSGVA